MQVSKNSLIAETPFLRELQYTVYGSRILYFARNILIQISFGLLISFILYPICVWLEKKGLDKLMAIVLSISLLMMLGLMVVALLIYQYTVFLQEWPAAKFSRAIVDLQQALELLGFSKTAQTDVLSKLSDQSSGNFFVNPSEYNFCLSIFNGRVGLDPGVCSIYTLLSPILDEDFKSSVPLGKK